MEPEINCSDLCDSLPGQELDRRPIHDLCKTTIVSKQPWRVRAAQKYMCCGVKGGGVGNVNEGHVFPGCGDDGTVHL